MRKNILLLCILIAIAISTASCRHRPQQDALSEKINMKCAIYFNRVADASSSGVTTGLSGKLVKVTSEWIVIDAVESNVKEAHGSLLWVPRNAVLYIKTE
jgi:hypothetical protein